MVANLTSGAEDDRLIKVDEGLVTDLGATGTTQVRAMFLTSNGQLYVADRDATAGSGADRILLLTPGSTPSAVSQWASSVVGFSSEWTQDGNSWRAIQALGEPDTFAAGDYTTAWSPSSTTSNPEYLHVGFTTPVYATSVRIRETYLGSFVTGVELVEPDGTSHTLSIPSDTTSVPGYFEVSFPTTDYLVKSVLIRTAKSGYEEIDAVELNGFSQSGGQTVLGRAVSTTNPLEGSLGNFTVLKITAMDLDPVSGMIFAIHRREDASKSNTLLDVMFQIDPETGMHVEDAFGAGQDYVVVGTNTLATPLYDIDDFTFLPRTGELFAIANDSTTGVADQDRLVKIDTQTGDVTDIGRIVIAGSTTGINDVGGLNFDSLEVLRATTGIGGSAATNNTLWRIDPNTAEATREITLTASFAAYTDYQALACTSTPRAIPQTPSQVVQTGLTGSIGDLVFADTNANGVIDAGEPGLSGVKITVTNGTITKTAISDGLGKYRVFGLTSNGGAPWTVSVDLASLPENWVATTSPELQRTLPANGAQIDDADFGFIPPVANGASVAGTLWFDFDHDGVIDDTEPFIGEATIRLYRDLNGNGTLESSDLLMRQALTDVNGVYRFTGLGAASYLVDVVDATLPAGLQLLSGPPSLSLTTGLNRVTLAAAQELTDVDFGYDHTGVIGDLVFYDTNFDGVQDLDGADNIAGNADDEPGIASVGVTLYADENGNGEVDATELIVKSTLTDATGKYLLTNVPEGRYVVRVEEQHVPAPPTSPNAGKFDTMLPTTGEEIAVELNPGESVLTVDFGFGELALIEGHVFHDVNSDGIFVVGEPGLAGVSVNISGTSLSGASVSKTVVTGASGAYSALLVPGSYIVAYDAADPDIPGLLTRQTTEGLYRVVVNGGNEVEGLDFGRDHAGAATGVIFADSDGSGSRQTGESGLRNVVVELYNSVGSILFDTTITGANGVYRFEGLASGTYLIKVRPDSLPAGYDATPTADPVAPNDGNATATVVGAGTVSGLDFGYRIPTPTFSVSGRVWDDGGQGGGVAGDGIINGTEPGLATVDIEVQVDVDSDGEAEDTLALTTDASGNFTFPGITAGSRVTVLVDGVPLHSQGYVQTGDPDAP
ncbi:MAG: SdrD B-like domain-containing protein [Prosthecobacter sp.]